MKYVIDITRHVFVMLRFNGKDLIRTNQILCTNQIHIK